jgi:site-specific recombinase XerD
MPLADWPERHQVAWKVAFNPVGLFSKPSKASGWRPASINKTRKGYGIWLSHRKAKAGLSVRDISESAPEDLVTRDAVLAYIEDMQAIGSSSMTVYNHIQELYDAIRILTPHLPDDRWDWLGKAYKNLRSEAHPSRNKIERLKHADQLEDLGLELMAKAEAAPNRDYRAKVGMTELQRSLMYRDGLICALLARRPFRIKNFYSLTIGTNFLIEGDRVNFAFSASEMKGKRTMEVPFPKNLLPHLTRYIEQYRPILLTTSGKALNLPTQALWISRDGTDLTQGPLHVAIRKRTKAAFGKPIPPHWFRDSVTTTLIRDEPASARIIGTILGHTKPDIANKHYNQSRMVETGRRHVAILEGLIDRALSGSISAIEI